MYMKPIPELTAEELKEIDEKVEAFLTAHPEAPKDIVSFLRRKAGEYPSVDPREKLRYIANYNQTAALHKEFSGPLKVTQVSSIQEAMDITLKDIKDKAN